MGMGAFRVAVRMDMRWKGRIGIVFVSMMLVIVSMAMNVLCRGMLVSMGVFFRQHEKN
jgi:hypothetical protein